jgi:hypothetical protein
VQCGNGKIKWAFARHVGTLQPVETFFGPQPWRRRLRRHETRGARAAMQNTNLWLAVDRLRAVAAQDPDSARELAELIELIHELDGAHAEPVSAG